MNRSPFSSQKLQIPSYYDPSKRNPFSKSNSNIHVKRNIPTPAPTSAAQQPLVSSLNPELELSEINLLKFTSPNSSVAKITIKNGQDGDIWILDFNQSDIYKHNLLFKIQDQTLKTTSSEYLLNKYSLNICATRTDGKKIIREFVLTPVL
jgi:hypothetical protein